MVKLLASYNEEVKAVVLSNALLRAGLSAPQLASCCAICLEEFMYANGDKIPSRGYLSKSIAHTLTNLNQYINAWAALLTCYYL